MPRALIYAGVFVPHYVSLELFLRSHGIAYQPVSDEDLEDFRFLPLHRLFVFPPGHNFGSNPENVLGGRDGIARLKQAIADGMNYLGICAGACAAARKSWHPIDISLGLTKAMPRWPGEHGAGVQLLTARLSPWLMQAASIPGGYTTIWYHNGPIWARSGGDYEVLATFAPTREEREQTRQSKLFRKHLTDAPAIIECQYGKGRVVLCTPHPEYGDHGLRDWQRRLNRWLDAAGFGAVRGDPLAPGMPGYEALMRDLGGTWMEPVRMSANWRLLYAIVDRLLH